MSDDGKSAFGSDARDAKELLKEIAIFFMEKGVESLGIFTYDM